jgi:pimeloyl-ACP methyl ester carboxylesterase
LKKVYFLSGLGADERVFYNLNLPDISPIYISWETPDINDTMSSYAGKLLKQIDLSQPVILIGLSFGGMIAVELSRMIYNCQTILISSALSRNAIPLKYKLFGKKTLLDKIPFSLFSNTNRLTFFLFGINKTEHKNLIKEILNDTDEHFFRWAICAVVDWESEFVPPDLTLIHGTKDKILPYIECDAIRIEDGGHLMILDKVDLISTHLNRILEN